ncbi:triose-phosphate isomerase [Candidatus Wolfebacteria bacterium]|nr:MAG: triose-phosphate isomerase [Candidatus Wolfebacteria bacterium]
MKKMKKIAKPAKKAVKKKSVSVVKSKSGIKTASTKVRSVRSKKLIVANWKMNPGSIADAKKLFLATREIARNSKGVMTIVCPPLVYLDTLRKLYTKSTVLGIGAQTMSTERVGSVTGECSASQIKSVGAGYVIVGHSEARARGESDHDVNHKIHEAILEGITVILCIGEGARDDDGDYLTFIRNQIFSALSQVDRTKLGSIIIAYEPIWAIGQGRADIIDGHEVHKMVLFIKKTLREIYKDDRAMQTKILYGGSVVPKNAKELMHEGEVDGVLVGGASLRPRDFEAIVAAA